MTEIIGQEKTVKQMKKIVNIFLQTQCEVKPHFILTGPSGSGKSFSVKQIATKHKINFIEVNAAQLTKEGTSGNSLTKALAPLSQYPNVPTIVFVDEFDKLFISGNYNTEHAHETTNGVQNEFLKVLESEETSIFGDYGKYINVSSKNVLFVFAGAFNGEEDITIDRLRAFGMKTEFLGRVGLVYNLCSLDLQSLYEILEQSELLENYLAVFKNADRDDVISQIKSHLAKNHSTNTLGARTINTLIHQFFINGGVLKDEEVKKVTFQQVLELEPLELDKE